MKEKDTAAEARFAAFWDYYERGIKSGTIKNKSDFARQLGVTPNTLNTSLRDHRVTRTLYLRLQGLITGFDKDRTNAAFVQVPAEEYDQMRKAISNLSATAETQARVIARLTQKDFDDCEKAAE